MKHAHASEFPELRKVFTGYLHEDFLEEYATPAAALKAFEGDADESERRRFHAEVKRFLEVTESLDFADVRALMSRLGCRWTPPTREALIAALGR
jgi:contact-dependent growth inhibition (CDI) system CdiI-like immunity protein